MKTQEMTTRKSEMRVKNTPLRAGRRAAAAATAGLAVLFAACDVTNPGPVQDEFLNLPEAHQALVNGSHYTLSQSFGLMAYMGAHAGRELLPSGQGGPGGLSGLAQAGRFVAGGQGATGGGNLESAWSNGHEARWIAEEALRRFTGDAAGTVDPDVMAEANLWAAYSNRTLGQNMCEAVFDGQGAQPSTDHMVRAEAQFTQALSSGDEAIRNAARAGRAYVRLWLGDDLAGAASDAVSVPLDFVFEVTMEFPPTATQNPIYAGNENAPVRAHTIHHTWFFDYYLETGDPRAAWAEDPDFPTGSSVLEGFGKVPWSFSLKYESKSDGIPLSSGREMVLIRAEILLEGGNWQGALDMINSIRTSVTSDLTGEPLDPWEANTLVEAWTALKRERSVEFWLEGQRNPDLRRWEENGTPGEIDFPDWESLSPFFAQNAPSRCIPIPDHERDANPNLPNP